MLKKLPRLFFLSLTLCTSLAFANNEHLTVSGNWDIHHISFPSTFIKPNIAKATGIKRSGNSALINISIIDNKSQTPLQLNVAGHAKNLVGHIKKLSFNEVNEGDAIYYLAQVNFRNEETLTFYITVKDKNGRYETITFKNKFYTENEKYD